ncbi:unannotated protein [freshwater metagenome]|uniref:Unannotated protein n=1 Tax=freshwater metagenome TaxID=449393 RepID=A0A6J6WH95_9ZZZZ
MVAAHSFPFHIVNAGQPIPPALAASAAAPVVGAQKDPFHAVIGPQDEAPG